MAASSTPSPLAPPPTNTASGVGSPDQRCRRAAFHDFELRHAERSGIAPDAAGAIGARLDRHGAHRRMGEQPLDGNRA